MDNKIFITTIYNPVYNGHQQYIHHKCSECGFCIELDEWQEDFKYCPNCGLKVIRYGEPIFDSKPDFNWLEPYIEVYKELEQKEDEVDRHLEYLLFVKLNDNTNEFLKKLEVAIDYWNDRPYTEYKLCNKLKGIWQGGTPHYTTIRKLRKEFEND